MNWFLVGSAFILVGVLIIVSGTLYGIHKTYGEEGQVRRAGVVMIGPIPIVFGSDVASLKVVIIMAIA